MHYQTNKINKLSDPYNIFNYLQDISQDQKSNTLQPKSSFNSKQENIINTENSENTINNINPLSKSKDSNSNRRNSSQNNLFYAVEYNDIEKAEQILKNDPSQLNELNDEGISPLHISVIKANVKMINLLLKYGANANILSEKKKQTPLHLAYLNQNSMTEEILQELKNYNASDSIYDTNNKKPSDYLNNSYLKKHNNNTDGYSSSADKRQIQSNNNTVMVITNENHFDSFMTTNKEDDNKSNVNSTINNNTIQTPTKLEGTNINEYDYNNEPTITINSNNKYNTNNTINSKSDSLNRRQYTFGKEEDYYKYQRKNSDINLSNNNIHNYLNNNINNNSIKNMDINYNNINKNNGKDNNDFMDNIIKAEKLKDKKINSQPLSPHIIKQKKIENESKNELNDSLEEEEFNNRNYNNIINKNKNKFYLNNINVYINDNSQSYKSSEKSNCNNPNNNMIYNVDSFTKNNGLISNSMLTYTESVNANGSTPQSKKISALGTITNSLNSNLKDNIEEIELKLPHTTYNHNSNILNENINNDNIININNNNTIIDNNNNNIDINPNSNLNIDDIYKRIILKKRDSFIKSHRNCYSGLSKFERNNIDAYANNLDNSSSMNNMGNNKNSSFNSQNSNKNSDTNNVNRTIIHNTSKDNNSSFRNITVIHNNNSHINGIYEGIINNDNNISYYKEKDNNDNSISLFTTKSQTNKLKSNGLITNNINENIPELNKTHNIILSRNNNSNNNSFLTNNNNNTELNLTNNNKNISEFKYIDNSYINNNILNNNYMNNSNDNSNINININEIVNEENKNLLSSLKYWLNNIELINYYPNFINNSIIDISILIEKMKSYQTKLKFENIESSLKIRKPGHIYRILCRLEVDANLIDNKITKFLLKNNKIFNKNDFFLSEGFDNKANNNNLHLLISQDYQCLGCCKTNNKFSNMVKNDLKSFLKRYGLLNFYQNFYHNGFEYIEYVILQMYGGYPINDDILENCFHVYDEEQRKRILKAIVNEMKKINEFLNSDEYINYQNIDLIKYENIIFYDDKQNSEDSKIMINKGNNSNCNIF